jgi:hypothetical protein
VLIGASRPEQLEVTAASVTGPGCTADELAAIDEHGRTRRTPGCRPTGTPRTAASPRSGCPGTGVVGPAGVSGLPQVQDHEFVVEQLRAFRDG